MQLKLIDIALMNVYSVVLSLLLECSWLHKASPHVTVIKWLTILGIIYLYILFLLCHIL